MVYLGEKMKFDNIEDVWCVRLTPFLLLLSSILPIHLNELAPPNFRALLPGVAFQLGAMISAPCTEMVNALAESHHVKYHGREVEAYSQVIITTVAICAVILVLISAFGPERRGSHFEVAAAAGTIAVHSIEDSQDNATPVEGLEDVKEDNVGEDAEKREDEKVEDKAR
jgi:hypothetical protein